MILLDTHAWIWWTSDPSGLSPHAKEMTDAAAADERLYLSCISTWEVAMLVHRGRLALSMEVADWVNHSEALPFLTFVPITNPIALRAVALELHPDPADRQLRTLW